jgi:hypothetical protein
MIFLPGVVSRQWRRLKVKPCGVDETTFPNSYFSKGK